MRASFVLELKFYFDPYTLSLLYRCKGKAKPASCSFGSIFFSFVHWLVSPS